MVVDSWNCLNHVLDKLDASKLRKSENLDFGGTPFGGSKYVLTSKSVRNVLISNYHKFKKIQGVKKIKFRPIVFFLFFPLSP